MSTILYHGEPNGPSLAVLAALGESGLDIECQPIDLLAGERHRLPGVTEPVARDMGVEGEGPVLVIDGEAMTESVFIAQYLDETGANTLQPRDAYAHWQMLMWCRRITERCAPAAAFLGCKAQAHAVLSAMDETPWGDVLAAIASEDLRGRWSAVRTGDFPEAPLTDSANKVADAVAMVEQQLADGRDWLMGDLTVADFETYGWLAGMPALLPAAFAASPRTAAWLDRVRTRPSVQAALARAATVNPEAAWAPGPEINRWG
ncbi:glutathione S-transferase [Novosphingobium flavum]|uniref:Glutathione S-transferase n=1 Tax=Novosphingobium aerophilum TaxID=2839843 RepID=A0A7X1F6B1_9SPHN|nr:glutathione S-transferase [Novosphingobium aerophilum]MBC2651176.1 glutathione S-transferase [Novosphingobium aerophilum]MBC2660733.1 glutathione S-transferase [Novosphingobium aerophilum]